VVAPHVQRYLAQLAEVADRLVVVSTAELTPAGRHSLERHGELLVRRNEGYDFLSWKTGLEHVGDWDSYDRVLICNDSVVGPFRPLADVLGSVDPRDVDFWGITESAEIAPHLQSWFVVFERPVLRSGILHGFWRAMRPESDRYWVIRRYEIGMSRLLLTAGFRMGSYYRPTPWERVKAARRYVRYVRAAPGQRLPGPRDPWPWNPMTACWDAALDGRLPFAKIEVLRDDPYGVGADSMLAQLEAAQPDMMTDVRQYLDRTRTDYQLLRPRHFSRGGRRALDADTSSARGRAGRSPTFRRRPSRGRGAASGAGGS
jgi:hypothetical protein